MDDYPHSYVEHNLPLVLLSGLGEDEDGKLPDGPLRRSESGARIITDSSVCRGERARQLLTEFKTWDGNSCAWNITSLPGPTGNIKYCIKAIGRTYTLPARKAAPVPQSPGVGGSPPPRSTELHSPLSPLCPASPVFPDGLLTPLWFSKHQRQVPSLFLAFFDIADGESGSQDEQLKADINAIRSALSQSGYRTRLAVVLLGNKSILHMPELEERIASIRRATALDHKTGLFFNPPMSSQVEVATFVQTTLAALQPPCVDYYRELTKHARRKKTRAGTPLRISNVRYEVKQGVFAEFRQEMDVAERHYSGAIEELFGSEGGFLETTNSWSPRWNEARLLCDSVAIRLLRCLLWSHQTTSAIQSWNNYKHRMRDLVDRRGKGSSTYGWDAWEARWSKVMAQLIQKADLQTLRRSSQDEAGTYYPQQVYAMPEKASAPGDRLPPFNFLHHPGYFLSLLARGIRSRWAKALAIPEDDRVPPDRSPASSVANRSRNYDLYLVPDPHEEAPISGNLMYDHAVELEHASIAAAEEFEARRQLRMSEQIRLELAGNLVDVGRYTEACKVLMQLCEQSSWRQDHWRIPFSRLLQLSSECFNQTKTPQNAALTLALTWELLSMPSTLSSTEDLDITQCLADWDVGERIELHLHNKHKLCPITCTFSFKDREGHVGEPIECQLALTYDNVATARPIKISRLDLWLETTKIRVWNDGTGSSVTSAVDLYSTPQTKETSDGTLDTSANLNLNPAQTRVLHIVLFLKEAQALQMSRLALHVETSKFALTHEFAGEFVQPGTRWYLQEDKKIETVLIPHVDTMSAEVLPKPPKMKVHLHGLRKQYYTDEQVCLGVGLANEEVHGVHATLVPKIIGTGGNTLSVRWADSENFDNVRLLEKLDAAATHSAELVLQGPPAAESYTLTLDLRYTLLSEPDTPLTKTVTVEMVFVSPFEAKFTFSPRLHPDPWPSYFNLESSEGDAQQGIPQHWSLGAQIASLVDTSLQIHKLELEVLDVQGDATCNIRNIVAMKQQELLPNNKVFGTFEVITRKASLEDRRPSYLELSLVVTWSPSEENVGAVFLSARTATTAISVPRLAIPTSEPRVLCTNLNHSSGLSATLQYHLENPSTHFLTFGLTMEASEDFAFSGPKHRALSLAPLSRHIVEYELLLHKELNKDEKGIWASPNLQVVDSYYQKKLLVHPGGESTKVDAKTNEISIWVGNETPLI